MKRPAIALALLLAVTFAFPPALAAEGPAAEDPFARAARWQPGTSRAALVAVADMVVQSQGNPAERRRLAKRLADMLGSDATTAAKQFALRQLRVIGSGDEVPAIAALLTDRELSHMARYALQAMEAPAAAAAMRDALGKVDGGLLVGLVNSLGEMRDAPAGPALIRMLDGGDRELAGAAVAALGRIATPQAAEALAAAREKAPDEARGALTDALLVCADRFAADGKADEAAAICERLFQPAEPQHVRVAALRGIAAARKGAAAPLVVRLVHGDDLAMRPHAARVLDELPAEAATRAIAAELPKTPEPQAKIALLTVLDERKAANARQAVLVEVRNAHREVRLAAIRALGSVGSPDDVPLLIASLAGPDEAIPKAAEESLCRLQGDGVNRAIVRAMASSSLQTKERLVRCLGERRATDTLDQVLALAGHDEEALRTAAVKALGQMAAAADLPKLAGLLARTDRDADRAPLEQAMMAVCQRSTDAPKHVAGLLKVADGAGAPARCALLRVAARLGGPEALAALRSAIRDADAGVRDTAVRALAAWPDAAPADDLLALARGSAGATHKVLALRGYVRMAGLPATPHKAAMYQAALAAAERVEDKKLVLSGMGSVQTREVLQMALPFLAEKALAEEAAAAVVAIASGLRGSWPAEAEAALEKALGVSTSQRTRDEANAVLDAMRKYRDFLTAWMVSGPYEKGADLFDTPFEPEKDPARAQWKPLTTTDFQVNLGQVFGGSDRVAYLKTNVWAPADQEARVELGSDDGIKVWLNGRLVHANNASRPVRAGEDKADVKLGKGWNTLLLKVTQGGGDWGVCLKLVGRDGKRIDGLRVSPMETK